MPLYRDYQEPSGRMGALWTLAFIKDAAVLEYGCMGHMVYAQKWLNTTGIYDRGNVYSTHLDEKDVILGSTDRLRCAVRELHKKTEIKAIFILPSSTPEMTGVDLEAECEALKEEFSDYPITVIGAGGFQEHKEKGIEEALYQIVKNLVNKSKGQIKGYNIIGSVCDRSRFQADALELERIMRGAFHMEAISTLTSNTSVTKIEHMGEAAINLVIREEGKKAAEYLNKEFGTPYLYEAPYGYTGTTEWINRIEKILGVKADSDFMKKEQNEGAYLLKTCNLWAGFKKNKAVVHADSGKEPYIQMLQFILSETGFKKGEDGICLCNLKNLKEKDMTRAIEVERSVLSNENNIYQSPFMGFHGAMKLCDRLLKYLNS